MAASQYSPKEREMFKELGLLSIIHLVLPNVAYRLAVDKVFIGNITGPATESLRRCYKALSEEKVNRLTPEWDEMIDLWERSSLSGWKTHDFGSRSASSAFSVD